MDRDKVRTARGEVGWFNLLRNGNLRQLVEDASKKGSGYDGEWRVSGGTLYVDALKGGGAWLGVSDEIADFEFKARMAAPTAGGHASIFFRQHHGGQRYYQFDLKCDLHAIMISKTDNTKESDQTVIISAVNMELVPGREYEIELAARGESITTYVGGQLANQVHDGDYKRGVVCLTAWQAQAHYVDPCLRRL